MTYRLGEQQCGNLEVSTKREWLLTNGIGGYAMGTPSGINTRRYHGHLIAAIHPPADRMVLLAAMDAFIQG
ncbi:MAG: glycogen debranching enzyme N-terminal domain-containing protein, partial [Armatimonadetes bacterium]|nr:glycogen debranching enzyme N-terminal domain-containing protein [Armatimonadota bacterium]